ncbi:hypothetical protein, partial [Pseudoxanthomonas winnipegensis]|uniref:hypothetical protein n=1 Tax=Pseudoxanthomonas winnipegensis TaxID=2480810 RepID=UPI00197CEA08
GKRREEKGRGERRREEEREQEKKEEERRQEKGKGTRAGREVGEVMREMGRRGAKCFASRAHRRHWPKRPQGRLRRYRAFASQLALLGRQ